MKQIKAAVALACEYVANGSNGKQVLVNVYTGETLVRAFPARVPMAFYIEVIPDADMPRELKFEVFQNKQRIAELIAEFEYEAGKIVLIPIPQLPLDLKEETTMRVVASCEGFRSTTLLSKRILVGHVP